MSDSKKEGGLHPATRHPIEWKDESFYDEASLREELKRVFDICHGCRRCFNLCNAFPRLFDAIDESETYDVDGLSDDDFRAVIDDCYLCDRCFVVKCPYVPPHPFNVDFPHLMLRAKAIKHRKGLNKKSHIALTNTDKMGKLASIPVVVEVVNTINKNKLARNIMQHTMDIHKDAQLPEYANRNTFNKLQATENKNKNTGVATKQTRGKVMLFHTCFGRYNQPQLLDDLMAVFDHNDIHVEIPDGLVCCGMPKFELGDLTTIEKFKETNKPILKKAIADGYDIVTPIPSCTLMLREEWPLLFTDDQWLQTLKQHVFEPFEYLAKRFQDNHFNRNFQRGLGKVAYHMPCHLSALTIGAKTKDILSLIPDTSIELTDRCSGHNGTYGVRKETHDTSIKIGKQVFKHCDEEGTDRFGSDCPIAGIQIESELNNNKTSQHPLSMLRYAYKI